MNNLNTYLTQIATEIKQAEQHLAELNEWLARIEAAGMYSGQCDEQWKDDKYLYMRFRGNETNGLDKKGRLYVGCKPTAISEARRLARNREMYDKLQNTAEHLRRWLQGEEQTIKYQAHQAGQWPRHHQQLTFELLGLNPTVADVDAAPKGESINV